MIDEHAETARYSLRGGVGRQELFIYQLLLIERALVPVALLALIVGTEGFHRAAIVTSALIVWAAVTSRLMWPRLSVLKRTPQVLFLDEAVAVAVWLLVGHWRGDLYLSLAEPILAAAIFFGSRLALLFAALDSFLAGVSLGFLHLSDGRGTPVDQTAQEWVGPPTLFVAAAVVLSYVRHLLGRLDEFGGMVDRQEEERASADRVAAELQTRKSLVDQAHDHLLSLFPALRLNLNLAAADVPNGSDVAAELAIATGIAADANARLRALLLGFETTPAVGAAPKPTDDDHGDLSAAVEPERRRLYGIAVIVRLVFALSLGAFMYDEYRYPRFETILALWLVLLAWVVVTTIFSRRLYSVLRREPRWLAVEQALGTALMLMGTNIAGNIFWLPATMGCIFAAIVGGWRLTLVFGLVDVFVAAASMVIAESYGWQPFPSGPGIVAGTVGYVGVAAPAVYVSLLFERLDQLGLRFRRDARELRETRRRNSAEAERARLVDRVVLALRDELPLLTEHLARLSADDVTGEGADDLAAASSLLEEIDLEIGRLGCGVNDSRDHSPPVTVRQAVDAACERLARLGAEPPAVVVLGHQVLEPERADILVRFVAESLMNAWKYGAPPVEVDARVSAGRMTLTITDHGSGFDPTRVEVGVGLPRLKADAEALGGDLTVTSSLDGTSIMFTEL